MQPWTSAGASWDQMTAVDLTGEVQASRVFAEAEHGGMHNPGR